VTAVESSKEAKAVSKAKSALQKQVDTANERYTASAGVASEKTRTALKTAISEAKELIASDAASSADISSASKKLKSALTAVNDSINSAAGTSADGTQGTDGSAGQSYAPSAGYGSAGAGTGTGAGNSTTTPKTSTRETPKDSGTNPPAAEEDGSDATDTSNNAGATGESATGEGGGE
jgi:hypothetical protein